MHPKSSVRVATIWCVINLTWTDDPGEYFSNLFFLNFTICGTNNLEERVQDHEKGSSRCVMRDSNKRFGGWRMIRIWMSRIGLRLRW